MGSVLQLELRQKWKYAVFKACLSEINLGFKVDMTTTTIMVSHQK